MKDQTSQSMKEEESLASGSKKQSRFLRFFKGMFSSCCSTAACSGTCCASSCGGCSHEQEQRQMLLSDLKIGQHARIVGVRTCSACQFKLIDLGLSTGVDVTVRERALFGGPILVKARGAVLALRPSEASCITVSLMS